MNGLIQDVRFALRQLRLSPGFALVAIASLALGIGANTAIFQLLDAVRLRSLPILHPEELAEIKIVGGTHGFGVTSSEYAQLTRPIWQELHEHHEPFAGVFAWSVQQQHVGKGSDSRTVRGLAVSGDFFPVLGVEPWRGRLLAPTDEQDGSCTISRVVVSYPYWQSQMGGRTLTGNETLMVEGHPADVIGVTAPAFFGLAVGEGFDIAFPFCHPKEIQRQVFDISVMGRLRPGWTLERASAQLGASSPGIFEATAPSGYSAKAIQQFKEYRLAAYSASEGVSWLRVIYDSSLKLLLAITGLVLLIACANLANLMLARATAREREIAVRLALGASRGRLLRQSLAESALIAGVGTVLGIALAQLLSRVLVWSFSAKSNPAVLDVGTDWRVLLFAAAAAILTCLVFGVAPALRSTRSEPVAAMKAGGRGLTGSRERFSAQRLMVVVQISVSLALLVGALLFVRSFRSLTTFDPGMREHGITLAFLEFEDSHIPPSRYEEFKRELLDQVRSVPGVLDAAITTNVPLLGGSWTHNIHTAAAEGASKFSWVSPGYFKTMGISLQAGRGFNDNDTTTSSRVAIVNQAFIRQFLGGANPIGQTLRTSPEPDYPSTVYEIVGVMPDTKYNDLRGETPPMAFAPASQFPAQGPGVALLIYSNSSPEIAVKHKIAEAHPEIVTQFSDFQQDIRDGLMRERLLAMLSGFFGLLAGLLAMVGLYGVISYMVARRRNEIGIRVALGSPRAQVVAMVMREAGQLLLIGVVIGIAISLIAGRSAGSLLFELKPYDPLTLSVSIALLSIISALASFLPARRAAKVDPMVALRYE
ncbi:MAG TPA: ABC transporter permease [Terriglobales bacterium]|nr:ABC transporter permease [Terriglobales bacterium]